MNDSASRESLKPSYDKLQDLCSKVIVATTPLCALALCGMAIGSIWENPTTWKVAASVAAISGIVWGFVFVIGVIAEVVKPK
jgi:hypothetical protein